MGQQVWLVHLDVHCFKNKNLAIKSPTDRVSAAHTIRRGHLRDLEIYVKGHSRSLETDAMDRSYTTYY